MVSKKLQWKDMTPKERLKYINQDYISQSELTVSFVDEFEFESIWKNSKRHFNSEELKKFIIELHLDGLSLREISSHLPCSHIYAHKVIKKWKEKSKMYS